MVVNIAGTQAEYTYDGTEKTAAGYTVTSIVVGGTVYSGSSLAAASYKTSDFGFSGSASVSETNAVENKAMGLSNTQFSNGNANFEDVTFVVADGSLTINPLEVTVSVEDKTVAYNGSEQSGEVAVAYTNILEGQTPSIGYTAATGTDAGEYTGAFTDGSFKVMNGGTNVTGNYKLVDQMAGKLTITPLSSTVTVRIAGNTGTQKYKGTEQTVAGYTVTSIEIGDEAYSGDALGSGLYKTSDFSFGGTAEAKGTDAGTYEMGLKGGTSTLEDGDISTTEGSNFANTNANFAKVKFVVEDGELVIEPRTVTLTSASGSKDYDGTALTNHEVTEGGDGFAAGEGATYDVTGSRTRSGRRSSRSRSSARKGLRRPPRRWARALANDTAWLSPAANGWISRRSIRAAGCARCAAR